MGRVVIGLDKGHGDVAAFAYRLDSGTAAEGLWLDRDGEKVIPSAIAAGRDGAPVLIGYEAAKELGVICNFKTAPPDWREEGKSVARILMRGEIGAIYQAIWKYNTDACLHPGDEVFLYVGCPADAKWTGEEHQNAYQALICEATGLDTAHVRIVTESRAAIFNSFMGGRTGIQARQGVAVLDFGSSTADFTYLRTGEMMLERSWPLGASSIERYMLKLMLSRQGLSMSDIWLGNLHSLHLSLRRYKERYYSGDLSAADAVIIMPYLAGPDGGRISNGTTKTGQIRYAQATLFVNPDELDDFMEEALSIPMYQMRTSDPQWESLTWKTCCERFVETTYALLQALRQPCQALVLAGGASRMPFVQAAARNVFGTACIRVYVEDNPSVCVARGLCVVGKADLEADTLADGLIRQVTASAARRLEEDVLTHAADALAMKALSKTADALLDLGWSYRPYFTVAEIQEAVAQKIVGALSAEEVQLLIGESLERWQDQNVVELEQRINKAVGILYSGMLPAGAIALERADIQAVVGEVGVDSCVLRIAEGIPKRIIKSIIAIPLYLIFMLIPGFGGRAGAAACASTISGMAAGFFTNDPGKRIKSGFIQTGLSILEKRHEQVFQDYRTEFDKQIRADLAPELLVSRLDPAARAALEIAALKRFRITDN